ncbi:uncharacterized protein LOC113354560 isoform X3 [Papaver somniferum]|uniref:uncharacterized protein LOC113354560 isoform X3 n=1 Tax=Papaver somniferum TaxID=3469 RepID=UPI000E7016B1|nr:uncharacterized protein LOC113354560 isoform X3 [Papaver somniferum]
MEEKAASGSPKATVPWLVLPFGEDTRWDHVFLFCHPGDKNWRTQLYSQDTMFEAESLHCFKGKLYVIGFNEQQLEIEQQQQLGIDDDNVTLSVKPFNVSLCASFSFQGARDTSWGLTYCVECSDELFKIIMFINERGFEKVVISICITRLDFSSMEWKVVNNLGDHVLFIGQHTRVCCSAVELGLSRGCLYYTLPEDQRLYKFEVESAGDSVILPCQIGLCCLLDLEERKLGWVLMKKTKITF